MIKSIGIDIVRTKRIENDLGKFGERFFGKILGSKERELVMKRADKVQFMAGRFAVKEAIVKCLGAIIDERPPLTMLQVVNDNQGQPKLVAEGDLAEVLAPYKIHLSITHEKKYAAAVAVLEE